MNEPIQAVLFDKFEVTTVGCKNILANHKREIDVLKRVHDLDALYGIVKDLQPDLLIFGLNDQINTESLSLLSSVESVSPETKIILMPLTPDPSTFIRARTTGFDGYLGKDCDTEQLHRAVETIFNDGVYLTPTLDYQKILAIRDQFSPERLRWASLFLNGESASDIAETMSISKSGAYKHKSRMKEKIGVGTDEELREAISLVLEEQASV